MTWCRVVRASRSMTWSGPPIARRCSWMQVTSVWPLVAARRPSFGRPRCNGWRTGRTLAPISHMRMIDVSAAGGSTMLASSTQARCRIYDGDGDLLMSHDRQDPGERITLVPDALPGKTPQRRPYLRILWGQHLLQDLLSGRYRSLICAVNTRDNTRGIIGQL